MKLAQQLWVNSVSLVNEDSFVWNGAFELFQSVCKQWQTKQVFISSVFMVLILEADVRTRWPAKHYLAFVRIFLKNLMQATTEL